jgi:predicted dinucleotide-binding enzyme
MTNVTIIGTGKMGSAIGGIFASGGADIHHVNTSSTDAVIDGDIVVLAVPYGVFDDIVAKYGEQLAGKIVVDVTNPIDRATFTWVVPTAGSGTEELARLLPQSKVLKGFNTTMFMTLGDPTQGATVLVAGDDDEAKATVLSVIHAAGFAALDAGPMAAARELEAFAKLQIQLAMGGKIRGFAIVPA